MITVMVLGVPYDLEYNLYTMEMIEKEFGGYREMVRKIRDEGAQMQTTATLFRMMSNTAKEARGEEENATGKELRRLKMKDLKGILDQMYAEIRSGMRTELQDGDVAGDGHKIGYDEDDEEGEEKNVTAGGK